MPLTLAAVLALSVAPLLSGPDLEREAHAIDAMLIAPCCFTQQVSMHQSAAAIEVRHDVRARLAAGQTRRQILDAYVAQYGKRILAEPPAEGFDLTLYVAPFLMLIASLIVVAAAVRRLTHQHGEPATVGQAGTAVVAMNPDEEARLDDELRDLD